MSYSKKCQFCGKVFQAKKFCARMCSPLCRANAYYQEKRKVKYAGHPETLICPNCREVFPWKPHKKFCCYDCRQAFTQAQSRKKRREKNA